MHIKGVIFDLDGTLLDSMHVWDVVAKNYLAGQGIDMPQLVREEIRALSLPRAAQHLKDRFSLSKSVEAIVDGIHTLLEKDYGQLLLLKDGVLEMLTFFEAAGIPMCVATATHRRLVELALDRLGLTARFKFLITCYDVGAGKRKPDIFIEAARRLGIAPQHALVCEDAVHAIATAKAAGFPVLGIEDASSWQDKARIRQLCDVYLESWAQSMPVLEALVSSR